MKKRIASFAILAIVLGCTKDSDSAIIAATDNNSTQLKYTQLSTKNSVDDEPNILANFYYSDGKLKTIGYQPDEKTNKVEHIYSGDKITTLNRYSGGTILFTSTFQYNGENISRKITDNITRDYSYNNAGQLIEAKEYNSNVLVQTIEYKYDLNGNVSEKKHTGKINQTELFEYDSFKNQSTLMYSKAIAMVQLDFYGINNVTKNTKIENGVIVEENKYSYKYNNSGYPIEIVNPGGAISIIKYE
jgi:YD repeat-containing protein